MLCWKKRINDQRNEPITEDLEEEPITEDTKMNL